MIPQKRIQELAEERIAEHDPSIYIVEIHVGAGNNILVEIDKENGYVSIEDCVAISRNIEHNLDREAEDFSLEVSSAGIDKPLRVYKQFVKNTGRQVKVKLAEKGSLEGTLVSADKEGIVVETKEKKTVEGRRKKEWVTSQNPLKYKDIKETKLIITF
ncbi:MAG: ribosome assembly cofactor RimP [Crocinitomicaceae bacterium]|nr:ribosome assembly cofactor RimP [Crocinitomicaceae bacterium]